MTPRVFARIAAAAVAIVGLVLLLMPVSATVSGESGTCDSSSLLGGIPSGLLFNNRAEAEWADQCASATSTRQAWSWGLMGVGVLAGIGSAVRRPTPSVKPVTN